MRSAGSSMQATEQRPELLRDLNVWHATAIVVGTIIGSGIFLVPAEMMQAVGSAKLVYLGWVVGGLLSFFGALTYAELGALRPFAGGGFCFVCDGFGAFPAVFYSWACVADVSPALIVAVCSGLVRVIGNFPGG